MKCKLCKDFYKKYPLKEDYNELAHILDGYSMSPIKCWFDNHEEEWNCQTVGLIRDLVDRDNLPDGITYQYCDDQKYATINISDIKVKEDYIGLTLWISWYKSRGGTDAIWILDKYGEPRLPTEEELTEIYNYYKDKYETNKR